LSMLVAPLMKIGIQILDLSGRGPYMQWPRVEGLNKRFGTDILITEPVETQNHRDQEREHREHEGGDTSGRCSRPTARTRRAGYCSRNAKAFSTDLRGQVEPKRSKFADFRPNHSISSAPSRSDCPTIRPSVFAVLTLITSSKLRRRKERRHRISLGGEPL
jgi:hypothetical protein